MKQYLILQFQKMFYTLILLTSDKPSWAEKINYWWRLIATSAPVVIMLEYLNVWFVNNHRFLLMMLVAIMVNALIGAYYHIKTGTFSWRECRERNFILTVSVILFYSLLEMVRYAAGENFVSEAFQAFLQVTVLMYPISKSLKNIYFINDKKFPPAFIMERIYNFEKTGNINELFNDNNKENG